MYPTFFQAPSTLQALQIRYLWSDPTPSIQKNVSALKSLKVSLLKLDDVLGLLLGHLRDGRLLAHVRVRPLAPHPAEGHPTSGPLGEVFVEHL